MQSAMEKTNVQTLASTIKDTK